MRNPTTGPDHHAADPSFADHAGDPAGLLPAQCPAAARATTPELRLMAAVLAQALDDDRRGTRDGRPTAQRLRRKSRAWFTSPDLSSPFSFERVCAALGLDAEAIRERLAATSALRPAHHRRMTGSRARVVVPPSAGRLERRVA